jgi:tRNA threonylcarbamoyladenosine biosynthesis protein TsaB
VKILALDTATEACSAAVLHGDTIALRYDEPRRGHSELILPMVDAVLAESRLALRDLDAIAVGRGPGAFTGVRIAVGVAQGLAFGAGKLVVPVSDLAALAQRAVFDRDARNVIACIDARMEEVYWSSFGVDSRQLVVPMSEERVGPPAEVIPPASGEWWGAGTGWALDALSGKLAASRTVAHLLPRAREIALLARRDFEAGKAVPPDQALPVYLRDQVARPSRPASGN